MKKYNVANYTRLKDDIKRSIQLIPIIPDHNLNRDDLTVKYMPLVENLAKKFSTTEQASGVLDITDLMQYGYLGLIKAIDKINVLILIDSKDPEKTIKSFISKRVKGAIRRAINQNRGDMKIPEYKLNELRNLDIDEDEYNPEVALFFNQIFQSTDAIQARQRDEGIFSFQNEPYDIPDETTPYNIDLINKYLLGIMKQHLNQSQYDVLRLSYGLDTPKMSAIDIASILDMNMATASVRISQIKREAIETLTKNVSPDQIFEL